MVALQDSLQVGHATFNVLAGRACADPHHKGDLGIGQAHVKPQDQRFVLPGWEGLKGRDEKGFWGGGVRLSSLG